jgi:hypothetical protein
MWWPSVPSPPAESTTRRPRPDRNQHQPKRQLTVQGPFYQLLPCPPSRHWPCSCSGAPTPTFAPLFPHVEQLQLLLFPHPHSHSSPSSSIPISHSLPLNTKSPPVPFKYCPSLELATHRLISRTSPLCVTPTRQSAGYRWQISSRGLGIRGTYFISIYDDTRTTELINNFRKRSGSWTAASSHEHYARYQQAKTGGTLAAVAHRAHAGSVVQPKSTTWQHWAVRLYILGPESRTWCAKTICMPILSTSLRMLQIPVGNPLGNANDLQLNTSIPQALPAYNPNMSSPVPLLRPPIPGARGSGGPRVPRLGLSIPPSPNVRPLNDGMSNSGVPLLSSVPLQRSARPTPPKLSLATPMGSTASPYDHSNLQNGRPNPQPNAGQSASGGSESSAAHSRSGSFGPLDGRASGPTSAGSQFSNLSFASQYGLGFGKAQGTPDPASAVGSVYSERSDGGVVMERDGSMGGMPDISQLSLERGRTEDVENLDDDGWCVASLEKRIIELGSLGEGAGGAVTKCMLKGGKTIFALKVRHYIFMC